MTLRASPAFLAPLRAGALFVAVALLGGCETTMPTSLSSLPFANGGASGSPALTAELPPPAPRTWPDAQQDALNQRARGYGLVRLPEMQAYLDGLLARIKAQAGVPGWPGSVQVLATPTLEAYATAAGNIYVSQAWLASAQSEDEIVALLSHEFGHVYLHFHQLEGAVQDSNQAANVAAIGLAIAKKTAQATGWTPVDSLIAGYTLGRDLATSAWGRSQEAAADNLGLNVSLRLGYSYEGGFKAFLERLGSWEDENAKRRQALEEQLQAKIEQDAAQDVLKQNKNPGNPVSDALFQPLADLNGGITRLLHQGQQGLANAWSKPFSNHPETVERMDALALAAEPLPAEQLGKDPVTAAWLQAQRQPRTAATLKNYQLAVQAMQDLDNPQALALARQAATGPTASHALPLIALYKAQLAHPTAVRGQRTDPGAVLEANFGGEADRAWAAYVERSAQLQASGQRAAALKVMDQGFTYFKTAGEAWPQAIRFLGQVKGWNEAKSLAQSCVSFFPAVAEACTKAAASPADIAEADRKSQQKAQAIVDKVIKPK